MTQTKMPIAVGDKVRIVQTSFINRRDWGSNGEVGTVTRAKARSVQIEGVGNHNDVGGWFHCPKTVELFADELEDMPPDTITVDHEGLFQTSDSRYSTMSEECVQLMVQLHNDAAGPSGDAQ